MVLSIIGVLPLPVMPCSKIACACPSSVSLSISPKTPACSSFNTKSRGRAFVCSVALNYGGRDEIVHAANEAIKAGHTTLTEEIISSYTYTATEPDPDLVIRTGGDFRTSNFLLWQSAYSEYYVTKTLWPDFDENEIIKAVTEFSSRKRRFGGLDKEDLKEQ